MSIDNCSKDSTLAIIQEAAEADSRIHYISLVKNVGYQRSLVCALSNCVMPKTDGHNDLKPQVSQDLFAFLDVDCEDPPEMMLAFIEIQQKGYDVVYGERLVREEPQSIENIRKIFYRLTRSDQSKGFVLLPHRWVVE